MHRQSLWVNKGKQKRKTLALKEKPCELLQLALSPKQKHKIFPLSPLPDFFPPSCFFTLQSQWSNSLKGTRSPQPASIGSYELSHTECPQLLKWCSLCGVQGSCLLAWRKPCWVLSRPRGGRRALHPNVGPGQPPPSDGTLSSFVRRSMSGPPEGGGGGGPPIMICMTVIVWPPWEGHGWLRWVGQRRQRECNHGWLSYPEVTE